MDLLLHLNAKHYSIWDAIFHILLFCFIVFPSLQPSGLLQNCQRLKIAKVLEAALTKFPYHLSFLRYRVYDKFAAICKHTHIFRDYIFVLQGIPETQTFAMKNISKPYTLTKVRKQEKWSGAGAGIQEEEDEDLDERWNTLVPYRYKRS